MGDGRESGPQGEGSEGRGASAALRSSAGWAAGQTLDSDGIMLLDRAL